MDELRELGLATLFVTVSPSKNHEDRLMYGVRGIFAEYERTKIAERFRLGKIRKAKEGHIMTGEAPYGYTLIRRKDKNPGYYEINHDEAAMVRRIFLFVADEGMTLRKITRRLHEMGIAPRKSKRGVWPITTLSQLLRNKTYIGEGHFGATYTVVPEKTLKKASYRKRKKTSARRRPESEWIKIPTPAIVDRELFMRAQQRLKDNFVMARRNRQNEYLLSGKIRCVCGYARGGMPLQRGKYLYYNCTNRVAQLSAPANVHRARHKRAYRRRIGLAESGQFDGFKGVDTQTSGAMGIAPTRRPARPEGRYRRHAERGCKTEKAGGSLHQSVCRRAVFDGQAAGVHFAGAREDCLARGADRGRPCGREGAE